MVRINILKMAMLSIVTAGALHAQIVTNVEQSQGPQVSPPQATESLVNRFERDMMNAARAMPADRYDFTPASLHIPGANYTGVRTFAEEVKHVTLSNYATAANIVGTELGIDPKAVTALKGKDEIVTALANSFKSVHQAIATITVANQNQKVEDVGVGATQTRDSLAAWVAVHGYDHYGQMVEYLRMNGIAP